MSNYDQAQGPRLGQSQPPENPGVRIVTLAQLPEVAYTGQIVYLADAGYLYIYDGNAWQGVGDAASGTGPSGSRLFVGETDPALDVNNAVVPGDQWYQPSTGLLKVYDNASTWQDPKPVVPDGSITAPKIAAGAITTDKLAAGAITADKIDANAINGKTITGAVVQTGATGTDRALFYQSASRGVLAWLTSANVTLAQITSNAGALQITGPNGQRIDMYADGQTYLQALSGTSPLITLDSSDTAVEGNLYVRGITNLMRGRQISGVDFGNDTKTTDSNSDITINHSLAVNPLALVATPGTAHTFYLVAKDASSFRLRCRTPAGALLGSGVSVQALWFAIAAS